MREELLAFLGALGLTHFEPEEFLINMDRPGNRVPPEEIWGNIALSAVILDEIRQELGRPIVISSCYRAPEYNRRVGGRPRSQHQAFTAIDFSVAGYSSRGVAEMTMALRWNPRSWPVPSGVTRVQWDGVPFKEIKDNRFTGGVGSYSRFVHLDTRGINAGWRGN